MALTDYVVAVKRSNNCPITVTKKEFSDKFLKAWKPVGVELRDITEYVTSEDLLGQVQEFIENIMGYEFEGRSQKDEYVVEIYLGDWKHDHLNLDQLMKDVFNMNIVNSEVLDDGDGDCYSARRYYKLEKQNKLTFKKAKEYQNYFEKVFAKAVAEALNNNADDEDYTENDATTEATYHFLNDSTDYDAVAGMYIGYAGGKAKKALADFKAEIDGEPNDRDQEVISILEALCK